MVNAQTEIVRNQRVVNSEAEIYNQIRASGSQDVQLKKAASEFEAIFISQMFEKMDKTVEREDGIFGGEGDFMKNFKSFMFNQIGRDMAKNPVNTFGLAKQIYEQMKNSVQS